MGRPDGHCRRKVCDVASIQRFSRLRNLQNEVCCTDRRIRVCTINMALYGPSLLGGRGRWLLRSDDLEPAGKGKKSAENDPPENSHAAIIIGLIYFALQSATVWPVAAGVNRQAGLWVGAIGAGEGEQQRLRR